MSLRRTDKRLHIPAVGLAAFCSALLLWGAGLLDTWEFRTWDFRARWLAQKGAASDSVTLILLDQASLDWGKETNGWSWPWPREVYGAIVQFCRRANAKALGMDILFTEASAYGVEDDLRLAESMAAFGRTAAAVFPGEGAGSWTRWPDGLRLPPFAVEGINEKVSLPGSSLASSRAAFPIPEIAAAAAVLAGVHLEPDSDGVYRRAAPIRFFDHKPLLPLGLACVLAGTPAATVKMRDNALLLNDRPIPVDERFEAILRFRPAAGAYEQYSAAAIIQSELRIQGGETPQVTPQALAGKYVLLGFSAPGLLDLRSSPVAGVYPGVQIHATLLDNYLSGDFLRRLPGWLGGVLALAVALGCAAAVSVTVGSLWIALWCAAGIALPVALSLAFYQAGFWMPLVVCETAAAGSIFFGLTLKYATEGRQKRFIRTAFTQYISPAVLDQLLQHPDKLRLGGERRLISIFFSDLQGFTSISEQLGPEELTGLLNEYLTAMTDIIIDETGHGGQIRGGCDHRILERAGGRSGSCRTRRPGGAQMPGEAGRAAPGIPGEIRSRSAHADRRQHRAGGGGQFREPDEVQLHHAGGCGEPGRPAGRHQQALRDGDPGFRIHEGLPGRPVPSAGNRAGGGGRPQGRGEGVRAHAPRAL